jgi:Fe-S cluster biogenesis protein NfuA
VSEVDQAALAEAMDLLSRLTAAHAGGVALEGVSRDGVVRVRWTGACTGCPFRPMTMAGTLKPVLLAVDGVRGVEAQGSRISEEAEARIAYYFGSEAPLAWRA